MEWETKLSRWADLLKKTRTYFDGKGFTEVTTDVLVPAGAFESSIDTLKVPGLGELQSSPEIAMKALLAEAALPIYQIAKCYRDDPQSPVHRKEFTMLEFYQLGDSLDSLVGNTCEYLETIFGDKLAWKSVSLTEEFSRLGLTLESISDAEAWAEDVRRSGLVTPSIDDSTSDLFFRVVLEHIEPRFDPDAFSIVRDYPAEVSPLSAFQPHGTLAQRFEIYTGGMELCNGCVEMTDAEALIARWEIENTARAARKASPHPFPNILIEAARKGLPACAGTAIGLDRLFLSQMRRLFQHPGKNLISFSPDNSR